MVLPANSSFITLRFADQSYRAWRSPFVAHPAPRPDILAYSQDCVAPLVLYISWTGATEVDIWKIWTGNGTNGTFTTVSVYPKVGFETGVQHNTGFARYLWAEALDSASIF